MSGSVLRMKKPFVTFEPFDVVTMVFPYADRNSSAVRPSVILTDYDSFGRQSGIVIVAMITSAKRSAWPFDIEISELGKAGLRVPCVVRTKLNAIDYRLMDRKIGEMGESDRLAIRTALRGVFAGVLL